MRKQKAVSSCRPRPSKRKAKCAECEGLRSSEAKLWTYFSQHTHMLDVLSYALERVNTQLSLVVAQAAEESDAADRYAHERDTARKELDEERSAHDAIGTMCFEAGAYAEDGTSTSAVRNIVLQLKQAKLELAEANQTLRDMESAYKQYRDSWETYHGRIMDADRQAAEREYWLLKAQRDALGAFTAT